MLICGSISATAGASVGFGLLFCKFPPALCWMQVLLAAFGRVYYWYHYVGDVLTGCIVAYASATAVHAAIGSEPSWQDVMCALPVFGVTMKLLKARNKQPA